MVCACSTDFIDHFSIMNQPMYQREALWISFAGSQHCAVKIAVGGTFDSYSLWSASHAIIGVNALSGLTQDAPSPSQDYLSLPTQPWLDGVCTEPGVVRQVRSGDVHQIDGS